MRGWIIGLILASALVLGLGPAGLGVLAMMGHQALLTSLRDQPAAVTVLRESHWRGWLVSGTSIELLIQGAQPDDPAATWVRLENRIEQGPWLWLAGDWPPTLMRIKTRAEIRDVHLGGRPLAVPILSLQTDAHLDHGVRLSVRAPAGSAEATHESLGVRHGELAGELWVGLAREVRSAWLSLPELEVSSDLAPLLALTDLRLALEPDADEGATIRLDAARAVGPVAPDADDTVGSWSGLRAEALSMRVQQASRQGLRDLRLVLTADRCGVGMHDYADAEVGLVAERLDPDRLLEGVASLSRLVQARAAGWSSWGAVTDPLESLLPVLARALGEGRLLLDPVRLVAPTGPLVGRLDLRVDPASSSPRPRADTELVFTRARIDGELAMPETEALDWLSRLLLLGMAPRDAALLAAAREEARTRIDEWRYGGLISIQDGRVATALRLGDGLLTINGKTVPLRAMQGVSAVDVPAAERPERMIPIAHQTLSIDRS